LAGTVVGGDSDGHPMTFTLTGGNDDALFTISGAGALSFVSTAGADGTDPFGMRGLNPFTVSVMVTDNTDPTLTATNDVTVTPRSIGGVTETTANSTGPAITTYGTEEADNITAGTGTQIIFSVGSNDTIRGGSGNNTIYAGSGKDTITAGSGRTTMVSYTGQDHFIAGTGIDLFQYESENDKLSGPDTIDNFRQNSLHPTLADQIVIDTTGGLSHPGGGVWLDHLIQITSQTLASALFSDGTLSFGLDNTNKAALFWNTDAGHGDNVKIELARMTGISHMSASDVTIK